MRFAAAAAAALCFAAPVGCARDRYAWQGSGNGQGQADPTSSGAGPRADGTAGGAGASAAGAGPGSSILAEAEGHWARRGEREECARAVEAWEKAVQAGGKTYQAAASLSRACFFYAEAHCATPEERLQWFDRGTVHGEKALYAIPAFKEAVDGGAKPEDAVARVGQEGIDAIYWTAVNTGKWAAEKGFAYRLNYKDRCRKMIERVLAIDETYFYGAPHRYLGTYYSLIPAIAGRDLKKSKEHFDRSLAIAPGWFATKVLMAQWYAPLLGEEEGKPLMEKVLREVISGDARAIAEALPEQELEQRKAKKLLEAIDDQF